MITHYTSFTSSSQRASYIDCYFIHFLVWQNKTNNNSLVCNGWPFWSGQTYNTVERDSPRRRKSRNPMSLSWIVRSFYPLALSLFPFLSLSLYFALLLVSFSILFRSSSKHWSTSLSVRRIKESARKLMNNSKWRADLLDGILNPRADVARGARVPTPNSHRTDLLGTWLGWISRLALDCVCFKAECWRKWKRQS